MSHHIIEAENIHFTYPDGHQALHGVSFRITHGESVGVIGMNGAGKSTLLMLLMGILFADTGEIRIGHIKMSKQNLQDIRKRMGMVFQDPDDQLFMNTVYEDVAFGPRNSNLDEADVEKAVMRALEETGITALKDRAPYKLSAGEKRSAAIASVLSMEPDVLILDEPTSYLDPGARRRLIKLLAGFDHTKIITSHDLDMVLELCERTIIVHAGHVLIDGLTQDILRNEELLLSCGLEMPLSLQRCAACQLKQL